MVLRHRQQVRAIWKEACTVDGTLMSLECPQQPAGGGLNMRAHDSVCSVRVAGNRGAIYIPYA
jgi:hypothetical protein